MKVAILFSLLAASLVGASERNTGLCESISNTDVSAFVCTYCICQVNGRYTDEQRARCTAKCNTLLAGGTDFRGWCAAAVAGQCGNVGLPFTV